MVNDERTVNSNMVVLARQSRGLKQAELAERLQVSQGWLSRVENGLRGVPSEALEKLCAVLDYPKEFFAQNDPIYGFGPAELFHRSYQDISVRLLDAIHAQVNLRRMQLERMLRGVEIGSAAVPAYEVEDYPNGATDIAQAVRALWHIPHGPIQSLTKVIEDAGGIIVPVDFGTSRIDAISLRQAGYPLFFINLHAPGDRLRFTLAHELGHVVMHGSSLGPDVEHQANEFAAEFLAPARDIRPYLVDLTLPRLGDLKLLWKISMAALLKRAVDLGAISGRQYRSFWERMGAAGYRTHEPMEFDISPETPMLFREIIDVYREQMGYSASDFAKMVNLNEREVRYLYYREERKVRTLRPKFGS